MTLRQFKWRQDTIEIKEGVMGNVICMYLQILNYFPPIKLFEAMCYKRSVVRISAFENSHLE